MHPSKFGDSYDIVKRTLLEWLSSCGTWVVHPMYFPKDSETIDEAFMERFSQFLGVSLLNTESAGGLRDRNVLVEVASLSNDHLLLDPDTGLSINPRPQGKGIRHVTVKELVTIANARKGKLTLVFDQSLSRANEKERQRETMVKLRCLGRNAVHAFAYHSHANFVLASADKQVLMKARQLLEDKLPPERLLGL